MSAFRLPPIEAFLDAHREYIDRFGGDPGVRDAGRLPDRSSAGYLCRAFRAA